MKKFKLWTVAIPFLFGASDVFAQSDEAVFWQSISNSSESAEFCAYLEAFPDGKFAALAKLRVKKLGGACDVSSSAVPAPSAVPAATAQTALTPQPESRPAEGRFWSYEPYLDEANGITGRIVYRSPYFKAVDGRAAYIDIKNNEPGGPRIYWRFSDRPENAFGTGYDNPDVNVWIADYSTDSNGNEVFSVDSYFLMRDSGQCNFENVNFCAVKCAKDPNQFNDRDLPECSNIDQPWYEFRAEMNESKWSKYLEKAHLSTTVWITAGQFRGLLLTDGLAETMCEHVKGAQQYCGNVGKPASAQTAAASDPNITPLNEYLWVLTGANVRAAPETDGAKLTVLNPGDAVLVIGKLKNKNWYKVELDDHREGYVFGTLLGNERPSSGNSVVTAPAAAPAYASTPLPSSSSTVTVSSSDTLNLPSYSDPLCSFFGEWGGWKTSADLNRFSINSTDARDQFTTFNGFTANGVELSFNQHQGPSEVGLNIATPRLNGELPYDRIDDYRQKRIDLEVRVLSNDQNIDFVNEAYVGELLIGATYFDIEIPSTFIYTNLKNGHDVEIDISLKGSQILRAKVDATNYLAVYQHALKAREKMRRDFTGGRCGYGAGQPSASRGIIGCLPSANRTGGYTSGARFAVVPTTKSEEVIKLIKESGRKDIEVLNLQAPIYEIVQYMGSIMDGVLFYDRNIGVRQHPIGGAPLIIGEFVNLPIFKDIAKAGGGKYFRCELLVEVSTCPHPKTEAASELCK